MARFFGCNLEKKKQLNRTVLGWLAKLSDDFTVFVELEGSDFSVDFLVLKKHGSFNVESKHWRVREAHPDADWILEDGEKRSNPFLEQVLDQCEKIADYLIVQRDAIFGRQQASVVLQNRNQIKIFPVVAISYPNLAPVIGIHPWRRAFIDDYRLRQHLARFEWFPNRHKAVELENQVIAKLATLFHLEEIDPATLRPVHPSVIPTVLVEAQTVAPPAKIPEKLTQPANPYQYTYVVTGGDFYGRDQELTQIRRALEHSTPVAIVGLQRTGKSSLALESIRRLTHDNANYCVIKYDFRRLRSESPTAEEDLALEFIRGLTAEAFQDDVGREIEAYREAATKSSMPEQRRLFQKALLRNRARNKRTVLFLDECQELADFLVESRYRSFIAYLDSLCRERELGLNVVIACRPAFFEMQPVKDINLGRIFENITLGALEQDAAADIIRRGSEHLKIDKSAESRLLFLTGGHAFWIQFMCHKLFENSVLKNDFVVDTAKVNQMFGKVLKDAGLKPQFYLLYQEIEADKFILGLLKTIASEADTETKVVELATIAPEWKIDPQVNRALRLLVDNQIIQTENELARPGVRFQVEALRQWMRIHSLTI